LEHAFEQALLANCQRATDECGADTSELRRMIRTAGGIGATKQLLQVEDVSTRLAALLTCARLDLSVEAMVLEPAWSALFSEDERSLAQQRLSDIAARGAGE
jgi:hypothetical protein